MTWIQLGVLYQQGAGGLQARIFTKGNAKQLSCSKCINEHAFPANELMVSKDEVYTAILVRRMVVIVQATRHLYVPQQQTAYAYACSTNFDGRQ